LTDTIRQILLTKGRCPHLVQCRTELSDSSPAQSPTSLKKLDRVGDTAINVAALHNVVAFLKAPLNHGTRPTAPNNIGFTGLHYAVLHQNTLVARLLHKRGAMPDASFISGDTPLQLATRKQDLDLVQLLASNGGPLLVVNARGNALVYEASRAGVREVVRELLARGCQTDLPDSGVRNPPLQVAMRSQRPETERDSFR